jgi:hypothetical protein
VGGITLEGRGKTKIACWLDFVKKREGLVKKYGPVWLISPSNKRDGFREMKKDVEKSEWVLHGRFDK